MKIKSRSIAALLLASVCISLPNSAFGQEQKDLDKIAKKCGLKKGKLQIRGERIVLFAEQSDTFQSMGCTRAELDKIPGAIGKLGVSSGTPTDKPKAQ